jgi:hypothetical protein
VIVFATRPCPPGDREYRPWRVRTERLFDAVDTVDAASKRRRGFLRVE